MDVFIVNSYYHILIAISKVLTTGLKATLIIFDDKSINSIANNKKMIERIKKINIFEEVNIVSNPFKVKYENKNIGFYVKKILFTKFFNKSFINLIKNKKNIYIFNDTSDLGQILNLKRIQYILLEDGKDCFKNNNYIIEQRMTFKNKLKKLFFGIYQIGTSKYIKYIEVNDSKGLTIGDKKIVECNKEKLLKRMSESYIDVLFYIFDVKKSIGDLKGKYNLIITQPFFIDGLIKSEKEQLNMYTRIIDRYIKNEPIIIKIHPRENNIYSKLSNTVVINDFFPIELLNYAKNIEFDKVITISSTSIDAINNCKHKIFLGWDWLNKYRKESK